ncbi:BRCA1-associated RING domain protein 1-like isoform X1 [Hylaeus volcanicus]|uniref:BRCA1-associated RING domain protein 1-like isoform X1 n=2 Tax=Hylaeus volcanicus TaxID=313075 RepID=UPI0023B7ABAB|nr:BRCA1-associated RING domain protein 1-like isoform X1 [Hylaeus volcanicus]XP_053975850.1 BRCA1-associated RING domain protein 1-like isoform X1 [Hylaeus volcanicus]XP_053975851.1 BRCA1-associated RING domain protein 1-like isoform X1 [Hylaeus volcanicus]XP_053975852.1 BRCA1-associated RING domain protein 1-like isoform X1 [Hylaeus volcanicus]
MNTLWKNTRKALKDFANVLVCNKCGNESKNTMRYNNCGHFFCDHCIGSKSECIICNMPVQPIEVHSDHMIKSLTSYCNIIADIIDEKELWNKSTNFTSIRQIPPVILNSESKAISKKALRIPKTNINKPNAKGETKLHAACLKNNEEHVKRLLAAGANPNTKDNYGWTPLQEVVNYGFTNICQLLLACGTSPNIPGAENRTPLHEAAIHNRLEEAKLLLQYSAKKNVYDKHGNTPMNYCKSFKELWNLLTKGCEVNDTSEIIVNSTLNSTLEQSFCTTQSLNTFVVYELNLREENSKYLHQMVSKHKIKITSVFRSTVTHVIVEANNQNIVQLSYDIMVALLRGKWILNSEWIQLVLDVDDILAVDLELFEISGTPIIGVPKKARINAQNQNPGLFDQCHFYFAMQSMNTYYVSGMQLTKDSLLKLVREGNGSVLTREPRPDDIKGEEQIIPFHTANEPSHPLYKCTYYIIYVPGRDEPRVKYNMPHIKTLPLLWLIESIERFTLVDPSHLGLL